MGTSMFALKPRIEIAARMLLIAVVLFSALIPIPVIAKDSDVPANYDEPSPVGYSKSRPEQPDYLNTVDSGALEDVAPCSLDGSGVLVVSFGTTCALGPGEYTFHVVYVNPEATLVLKGNPTTGEGVSIQAEDITVSSFVDGQGIRHDGSIRADGQGHPGGMGPGEGPDGIDANHLPGGGGYGGDGGISKGGTPGGKGYGDIFTPTELGSGGGNIGSASGGAGGGAIKLEVTNTLTLNGIISANGREGDYNDVLNAYGGGGSGGSIWIQAASFTGSGIVDASGGYSYWAGSNYPGGGAGGRIAINIPSGGNTFTGNIYNMGRLGNYEAGGSGTIYWVTENKLVVVGPGSSYRPANTILVEDNYDFDVIDIHGFANVRIVGENSSLTINSDTVMLGDGSDYIASYYYGYNRLEVEGVIHAPDTLEIENFMLVPLKGLDANVQNIVIANEGGLELHADASPQPNGTYQFNSITVGIGNTWMDTLRLVPSKNDNEDYTDDYGVTLIANTITINSGGIIDAYGQGYSAGTGPGKGMGGVQGGGGGHGGEGTDSTNGDEGGDGYGNVYTPTMLGSGGGDGMNGLGGGAGGGAIKLEVDTLTFNGGYILVNGEPGGYLYDYDYQYDIDSGGGGSGGSVWIVANSMTSSSEWGYGYIYAQGGRGYHSGGSGGGGRVAIDVLSAVNFNLYIEAESDGGGGGTGTAYWSTEDRLVVDYTSSSSTGDTILPEADYEFDVIELTDRVSVKIKGETSTLTIDNTTFVGDGTGRLAVEGTIIAPADFTFSGGVMLTVLNELQGPQNITLQDGSGLELPAAARPGGLYDFGPVNITVANGGKLRLTSFDNGDTDFTNDYGVSLHVNNLTVDTGGVVEADGQGYPAASGPGKGADATGYPNYEQAGGAGYGGAGGAGAGDNLGGVTYGNVYTPTTLGSGGGNIVDNARGGAGGGAFKLEVETALTLNGIISANGKSGESYSGAGGGGSGGSIWIVAPSMTGSGQIQANGGTGPEYRTCRYWSGMSCIAYNYYGYAGGGGGGRIAVDAESLASTITISAQGGSGYQYGGTGTIFDGAVDPNNSTVEIVPSGGVTADGGAAATVTVMLLDTNNVPIINEPVEIAVASGWGLNILNIGPVGTTYVPIGYSDESGTVTAALTTTKSGARTLKARSGQILLLDEAPVEFVAGAPSIRDSSLSASRPTAPADGQTPVIVTARILDSYSNPVPGVTVTLEMTAEHATITLLSAEPVTDDQGKVQWEIKDANSETVAFRAWVGTNELANPPSIAFKGADVSISLTAPAEVPADRNAEIPYVVNVRNVNYLPAPDTTLTITLPDGVSCIDDTLEDPGICQTGQVLTWNAGLLDPGEAFSFTLYARIDSSWEIGETLQTTAVVITTTVDDDETNNSFTASTLMVSGYKFEGSLSPASQTMGIGGTAEFVIEVENTGLLADEYAVNVIGLDTELYTLSQTSFGLLPQEKNQVTLSVHYENAACGEAGSYPFNFTVDVVGQTQNETKSYPAVVTFKSAPTISDLQPEAGSLIGSRDVTISWRTDTPTTGVVTIYPLGEAQNSQTYSSPVAGTSHSVLVENLNTASYGWYMTATSACGGAATTTPQQFSVATGVVFKNHQQNYTINRDYDQLANVVVKNQSNEVREVQLSIEDPYEDLIVNFRGEGGVDGAITLLPREEREVELAIFAQDAAQENYSFNATLTSTDGVNVITDAATINVRVLFPTNYTVEEKGTDPLSGAIIYRVTNHGLPITDLNISAVEAGTDLPARVYITPQIVHARLRTDEWLEFKVLPLYSAEEATPVTGHSSSGKMLSGIHQVDTTEVEIVSTVAKLTKRHLMPKNCDAQIYAVTLHNVLLPIPFTAWYCTNREDIDIEIEIPPFVERNHVLGSMLEMGFSPVSAMRPHDTTIYFNGHEIADMPNQVPNGTLRFDIDPSYLNTNPFNNAKQTIHLHSVHNNIGKDEPHHSSQIGGTLYIALEEVTVYVCASSPEEAKAKALAGYGFIQLPGSFWVNILAPDPDPAGMVWPTENGSVNIQAHVGNTTTSYPNLYQVEANVEYLDVSTSEKILLYDDGLSAHADLTKGDGFFNTIWMPKYGGNMRLTVTAALPDGRIETDVRSFRINGQPDLAVTKAYIEEVALLNNRARVRAEITNLGFAITGPVNVDFVYYRTNANGNKIGEPIYTSHLRILLDEFGLPITLYRGQYIDIQDTEFLPDEQYLYFVEVIVDP